MAVRRIVANLDAARSSRARAFYEESSGAPGGDGSRLDRDVCGRDGWRRPSSALPPRAARAHPVPDLSIEVDDVDEVYRRAIAGRLEIPYGITDEPWGVRRFYVRDPFGRLVNILSHAQ